MYIFPGLFETPRYTEIKNGTMGLQFPSVTNAWEKPNMVYELWVARNSEINSTTSNVGSSQLDTTNVGYENTMK